MRSCVLQAITVIKELNNYYVLLFVANYCILQVKFIMHEITLTDELNKHDAA